MKSTKKINKTKRNDFSRLAQQDSFVMAAILQAEIFITKISNKRQLRPMPSMKVEKIIFPYI